jgi:hypothetical protein
MPISNLNIRILDNNEVPLIAVDIPTHGYYASFVSVYTKLTVTAAVLRVDDVHDGEWDEGESPETYWNGINLLCWNDEALVGIVARIIAGDLMGNSDEGEALAFCEGFIEGVRETVKEAENNGWIIEHYLTIGGIAQWCRLPAGKLFSTRQEAEAWMEEVQPQPASMRAVFGSRS